MTLINTIFNSIFFGFTIWTFLWVFGKHRSFGLTPIDEVDNLATGTLAVFGIFHLITIGFLFIDTEPSTGLLINERTAERAFGQYWFGFWIFPLIYFGLTQLLWNRNIREQNAFRIILAILVFVALNFEKFVIIATSMHREHSPTGNQALIGELGQNLLVNWLIYLVIFSTFLLIGTKIKTQYNNR